MSFRRRSEEDRAEPARVVSAPPPTNPIELGMALHSARERRGLTLEQVRDAIEVPSVDLDALERGQLELFHLQQSAVVALWRYAEFLELEPDRLLPVLQGHWPHRALSVNAFRPDLGVAATPVARLAAAARLLEPLLQSTHRNGTALGLSSATQAELATRRAAETFAASVLIPAAALATGEPRPSGTLRPGARPERRRALVEPTPSRGGGAPAPGPAPQGGERSAAEPPLPDAGQEVAAPTREVPDRVLAGDDVADPERGPSASHAAPARLGDGLDAPLTSVAIPAVLLGEAPLAPERGDLELTGGIPALGVDDEVSAVADVAAVVRAARAATGVPAPQTGAEVGEPLVAPGGLGQAMQRSLRYAGRLRHVIAERFGMDEVPPLPGAGAGNAS
ncbi:MAG: helix-turn-helix domain-containing protein [Actinomycetota bacterium]|nr:helix-turn-helix domain-containing protein [Actinomycetota bacterium]